MRGNIILNRLVGRKVIAYKIPLNLMPAAGGYTEITIRGTPKPYKIIRRGKLRGGRKCK